MISARIFTGDLEAAFAIREVSVTSLLFLPRGRHLEQLQDVLSLQLDSVDRVLERLAIHQVVVRDFYSAM